MTFIEGDHITLAEFMAEDYGPFYETWCDEQTQRNFNATGTNFGSVEQCRAFFEGPQGPRLRWVAAVRVNDETVGRIALAPEDQEPDIGVWIFVGHRGRGVGPQAVSLAVKYLFEIKQLGYIVAGIYSFNSASRRLFEELGFVRAPELDQPALSVFGEGEIVELGYRLVNPNGDAGVRR